MLAPQTDNLRNAVLAGQSNDAKAVTSQKSSTDSDQKLLGDILKNLRLGRDHRSDWRKEARVNYDFYAGKQWFDEDIRILEEQRRPAVVFNRVIRAVNAVLGLEIQNRQRVNYIPRKVNQPIQDTQAMKNQMGVNLPNGMPQQEQPQINNTGYADMLNSASEWVRDECNAEDEESEAFEDLVICGEGWTETRMSYDEDVEGMIVKDRLDPTLMLVDPRSRKKNYEDARWVAYVKDMSPDEVRELWPDITNPEYGLFWDDSVDDETIDADENYKYLFDKSDKLSKPNSIAVIQYQYYEKRRIYLVADPVSNNIVQLEPSRFNAIKEQLDANGIKYESVKKRVYYQCMIVGGQLAEKVKLGCDHFTLRSMTGFRDQNRNYYFGLVTIMQDPQRWANKWLSQIQYILNVNSKGGVMYEEGAIANIRKFEQEYAKPDGIIAVRDGAISGGKIKPKEMAQYPDGIDRLLNYAVGAINDVIGVNLEVLGLTNRDQPMGLEMIRKEAGITILAKMFDSLRRYRKIDGKITAYFIREYISDGRLVRITGPQGIYYLPLIKSSIDFKYDIIVDESPTSPNAKERTFNQLRVLLPQLIQARIPIPLSLLDYSPFPDALVQDWKREIASQSQPDPMQQKLKELEMVNLQLDTMQKQADIQRTGSETQKNMAAAFKDFGVGQEQSALAAQKAGYLDQEHNIKAKEMMADQARKDLELYLNQRRKSLEVEIDAMLRARKESRVRVPSLTEIQ